MSDFACPNHLLVFGSRKRTKSSHYTFSSTYISAFQIWRVYGCFLNRKPARVHDNPGYHDGINGAPSTESTLVAEWLESPSLFTVFEEDNPTARHSCLPVLEALRDLCEYRQSKYYACNAIHLARRPCPTLKVVKLERASGLE
jgi:hypothetical protein